MYYLFYGYNEDGWAPMYNTIRFTIRYTIYNRFTKDTYPFLASYLSSQHLVGSLSVLDSVKARVRS